MGGRQVANGLQVRSRAGADANTQEGMESKMTVGLGMETVGVMGKLKETAGLEAEMVVGTESGVDSKSTVDQSGAVAGAEASTICAIVATRGDAGVDLRSTVVGTATKVDAAEMERVQVGPIAETVPLACMGMEMGVETNGLGVAGGLRVACSWEQT